MSGLRGAMTLLTRVPLAPAGTNKSKGLSNEIAWFPVVGALVGALVGGVYLAGSLVFPRSIAAVLGVAAGVVFTGAIHEDGLADTVDALWGGWSREQRLQILKDPRIGTYGFLALLISFMLRISAIATLDGREAMYTLIGIHSLSRVGLALGLAWFRPVGEGSASFYWGSVTKVRVAVAIFSGVVVGIVALRVWVLPATLLVMVITAGIGWLASRRIGGVTGDVLGSIEQVAETSLLLLVAASLGS